MEILLDFLELPHSVRVIPPDFKGGRGRARILVMQINSRSAS
jgi:hypothetical protein